MTENHVNIFSRYAAVAVILAAYLIILFYRGFSDPDEGRYAEIPREMVVNHNWLEMRMLGYRYYEKPPLTYWLVAPAIQICGAKDWAVRIPLLFSGILGLMLLGYLAISKFGREEGIPAFLVMASTIGIMAGNGLLLTDSFLMTFFTATCVFLYLAFENKSSGKYWLYLLLAIFASVLGFLTKGAVAVVLPAAIIMVWLLCEKRAKDLFNFSFIPAGIIWILLVAPVMWLVERHNPGFIRFFYEEHIGRFQGTRSIQLHPEPFWFFLKVIPLLLLPWTLFLIRAARVIWEKRVLAENSFARLLVLWTVLVIGFFSLSTGKLMSYILPALPPLGILIGRWGVIEPENSSDRWDRGLLQAGVGGFYIVVLILLLGWCGSYFKLCPEKIYPITGISAIALVPVVAGFLLFVRRNAGTAFERILFFSAGTALSCALLLSPLAGKDFNVLVHINSSQVYKALAAELKPDDKVIVFWSYRPALPFYLQRLYIPFGERNELACGMQLEPERPADLEKREQINALWNNFTGRIFAVVEPQDLQKKFLPLNLPYRETNLPRDPDTIIYELLRPSDI